MSERDDLQPGATSEPAGVAPDYEAPGAAARVSDNVPPDTNQPRTEPIPADDHESAPTHGSISSAGAQSPNPPAVSATGVGAPRATVSPRGAVPEASRVPGIQGDLPADTDIDVITAGERVKPGAPPASSAGDADSRAGATGNAHGVSVVATESLEGSSEDSNEVSGVATPKEPGRATPQSTGSQAGGDHPGGTSRSHRRSAPDGEVSPS
jgi:hypothetical protein